MNTPTATSEPPKKKVPTWWKGEEAAVATSTQAARDLGYVVGSTR